MASQRRCDRAREGVAIVSEGVAVPERVWQGQRGCSYSQNKSGRTREDVAIARVGVARPEREW